MAGFDLAAKLRELQPQQGNPMAVELIDMDRLTADERNFYRVDGTLDELMNSIALSGLQQPVVVTPEGDQYRILSGHRRTAAIRKLVEEGREDLRQVPCIVKPARSAAMEELELIMANATARQLTSAETAQQAARVEQLLYRLKEEGVEFPGRMRDHVAAACNASAAKLARWKIIREKLIKPLAQAWKDGILSESAAYAVARMPDSLQEVLARKKKPAVHAEVAESMLAMAEYYKQPVKRCKGNLPCTNGQRFAAHDFAQYGSWSLCEGQKCCMSCSDARSCAQACGHAKQKYDKLRAEEKAKEANLKDQRRIQSEKLVLEIRALWARILPQAEKEGIKISTVLHAFGEAYANPKTVEAILAGTFDGLMYGKQYGLAEVDRVADVCRLLGCSADYLCGLPEMGGAPRWLDAAAEDLPDGWYLVEDRAHAGAAVWRRRGTEWYNFFDPKLECPFARKEFEGRVCYPVPWEERHEHEESR